LERTGAETVLLIHGSGPGVTSYANWRLVMPALAEDFHVIAPDMVGFGFSDRPEGVQYGLDTWADQTVGLKASNSETTLLITDRPCHWVLPPATRSWCPQPWPSRGRRYLHSHSAGNL
jgi:pimeloyl-ACP methyl ester carboxylesterase